MAMHWSAKVRLVAFVAAVAAIVAVRLRFHLSVWWMFLVGAVVYTVVPIAVGIGWGMLERRKLAHAVALAEWYAQRAPTVCLTPFMRDIDDDGNIIPKRGDPDWREPAKPNTLEG